MKIEINMAHDTFLAYGKNHTYYLKTTLLGYDKFQLNFNAKGYLDSVCFFTEDQEVHPEYFFDCKLTDHNKLLHINI